MKTITKHDFDKLEYKLASINGSKYVFSCQDADFDIELFPGDDDEHHWVRFNSDVNVLADDWTDSSHMIDGTNYLDIDACPEIIFDYLVSMI